MMEKRDITYEQPDDLGEQMSSFWDIEGAKRQVVDKKTAIKRLHKITAVLVVLLFIPLIYSIVFNERAVGKEVQVEKKVIAIERDIVTELTIYNSGNNELLLEKRASWLRDIVDGAISTFSLAVSGANAIYATACSGTFAAAVGLVIPGGPLSTLAACGAAGAALAVSNIMSYTLNKQSQGWTWGGGSNRDKREELAANISTIYFNDLPTRHITDNIFSVEDDKHDFSSYLSKRDDTPGTVINHGLLYTLENDQPVYIGYQFIADHSTHNKSVVIEAGHEQEALDTWLKCGHEQDCRTDNYNLTNLGEFKDGGIFVDYNDTSSVPIERRTGNLYWQSYNSYGYNGGYVQDWLNWGEINKMAQAMSGDTNYISQVQPCSNDFRCYAIASKWCLAGGMSKLRGVNSAFVGEIYVNGYGGVDGQCDSG